MSNITSISGTPYLGQTNRTRFASEANLVERADEYTPIDTYVASTDAVAEMARKSMEKDLVNTFNRGISQDSPIQRKSPLESEAPCGHSLADNIFAAFDPSSERQQSKPCKSATASGKG